MARIQILVGSVNGRAEQTARAVALVLQKAEHRVELNLDPDAQDLTRDGSEILLLCCSTTGQGDIPRSLIPMFLALDDGRVNLRGRYYGVIALGDSGYAQFVRAGLTLEAGLYHAGAKRMGNICILDAQSDSNQPLSGAVWASEWQQSLPIVEAQVSAILG